MKYFFNGTWVNDETITILPTDATLLSDTEWENRNSIPYLPTEDEVRVSKPTYQQLRAAAYPPLAEQMGAVWKGGEAAEAMKATIQAVKDSIPKT